MNRFSLLLLLSLGGLCLQGQTPTGITISTNPSGARFQVDGITYNRAQSFTWPQGSTHVVVFITDPEIVNGTQNLVQTDGSTQYAFTGWLDNNGLVTPSSAPIQVITANPAVTTFTATVTVSYLISLNYFSLPNTATAPTCAAPGAIPAGQSRPGVVYIGGTCYWSSTSFFAPANSNEILNAYPYPGFAFTGWSINGAAPTSFLTQVTLTTPLNITPIFVQAKLVSFLTSPPLGLQVLVDHTPTPTRTVADVPSCPNNETLPLPVQLGFPPICFGDFYFAPGSTHFISGVTPQQDSSGNWWVFSNWSNGLSQNAIFQVDNNTSSPATLTANYVQGATVAVLTNPTGLPMTIDGSSTSAYDFIWGVGTTHTVTANATTKGSNGRVYTFQNWSNQGAASQTITVASSMVSSGYRLTANYSELARVVVQSSPPGLTFQVDGANCVTPCNVDRATGATFTVTAPTQIAMGQGARLDFGSWSDGGASSHTVTVSQSFAALTASYTNMYQLSASSNPANGSSFTYSPSSSDMFYPAGTQVTVTATANPGFKFGHWNGALSGSYPSGVVTIVTPSAVIAEMATVPYIAPAGILNGVGPTPSTSVAPGSIISIFGQSLASVVQVGPTNPLSQSIAGTTVTINDSILPLMFISPTQINAQLPSSLPDGSYTLEVQNTGQPEISGPLTVARNAPGLFSSVVGTTAYIMAFHADGSMVSTTSPAAAGETISMLGTGFGPYQTPVLDGFFPPVPSPLVNDAVTLSVGGVNPTPTSSAAPGFIGVVSTQFQVPTGLPSGTSVPVLVTINGVDSNTVMLPIQ
jgi:uncharacterized protein (TIGR03437 family)